MMAKLTPIEAYVVRIESVTMLPTRDSHVRPVPPPHGRCAELPLLS